MNGGLWVTRTDSLLWTASFNVVFVLQVVVCRTTLYQLMTNGVRSLL